MSESKRGGANNSTIREVNIHRQMQSFPTGDFEQQKTLREARSSHTWVWWWFQILREFLSWDEWTWFRAHRCEFEVPPTLYACLRPDEAPPAEYLRVRHTENWMRCQHLTNKQTIKQASKQTSKPPSNEPKNKRTNKQTNKQTKKAKHHQTNKQTNLELLAQRQLVLLEGVHLLVQADARLFCSRCSGLFEFKLVSL